MSVIALLTDFGLQDPFVGVVKGVLASAAPKAAVVDLCHEVPPQDVRTAALFLRQSVAYFPKGTVFMCVVDPGVGTSRRVVAGKTKDHFFVGPDNGILSWACPTVFKHSSAAAVFHEVNGGKFALPNLSSTFHGRDIFAPIAARLSRGLWSSTVGKRIDDAVTLPWPEKAILAFDRFGNAITSIPGKPKSVRFHGRELALRRTYGEAAPGEPLALVGSSGLLELAVRGGSFKAHFGAATGDKVDARD